MLLDVAHVYEKFINPLPGDVEQFADELLKRFPGGIMDTKYIVKTQPSLRALLSMDTGLQKLFKATAGTEWNEGLLFSDYVETFSTPGLEHQAAYDAIVTGYVFLRLSHYVGRNLAKERPGTYMNVSSFAHLLPEYLNVLNVHNCDADLYLDRSRRIQVRQTRSDILLITGLSTAISTRDLRNAFKGYGITNVQWINDRYAYVQVSGTSSMQLDQLFRDVQNGSTSELKTSLLKLGINAIPFDTADENGIIDTILVGGKIETQERKPRVAKRTREPSAIDLLPNKKPLEIQEPKGSSCTIL
jgi:poly(A)-specific ribonuclease